MRPLRPLVAALLAATAAQLPAADFYRDPPPSPVFQRILERGEVGRDLRTLYQEARLVQDSPERIRDKAWIRRVKTMIMVLGCTDRRLDGDFVAGRLLDAMHARKPRDLQRIADLYNLRGWLLYSTGFLLEAEPALRQGVHYGNRARGPALYESARELDLLSGLLRAFDYDFLGQLMDDQARAFRNMIKRRMGGVRTERGRDGHERVPALVFRTLKDELVKVEQARLTLDASDPELASANGIAARENVPSDEYQAVQKAVLAQVVKLSEQRAYMRSFLFQLRRSSDLQVITLRKENIEDFRQLYRDLLERQQHMLGQVLVARYKNSF